MTRAFKIQSLPTIAAIPVRADGIPQYSLGSAESTSQRYILPKQRFKTLPHHGSPPTPAQVQRLKFG